MDNQNLSPVINTAHQPIPWQPRRCWTSSELIVRIDVPWGIDDIAYYFDGDDRPWNINEFVPGSRTHTLLSTIEEAVSDLINYWDAIPEAEIPDRV